MKKLLIAALSLISVCAIAQTYNPLNGTISNKPYSPSQNVPTDGRSWLYDSTNFIWRPYQSVAEANAKVTLPKYRGGNYSVYINFGGTIYEYWWRNGVADSNLVRKYNDQVILLPEVDTLYRKNDSVVGFTINHGPERTFIIRGTAASAGVNSLQLTAPSALFGTPVNFSNSSGNWTGSLVLNNQNPNYFFAGPVSGGPGLPLWRAIATADLPTGIPNGNLANSSINFTIGGTGTSPNWTSSAAALGGTATLNLPVASGTNTGIVNPTLWNYWTQKVDSTTMSNDSVYEWRNGTRFYRYLIVGGGGGAVASVSNSDGSLTISPTTGSVIASLNTAHANSFSAPQTMNNGLVLGSTVTFGADNTYSIGNGTNGANAIYARFLNSNGILSLSSAASSAILFSPGNAGVKLQLSTTGQIQFNGYTTSTSFTGTPTSFLQVDVSGNVIQTPTTSVQAALSGTGYVKFSGTTPSYLTPTQVTADLNVFTSTLQGMVPAPGTVTGKVLSDNGTWISAGGTGTVTSVAATVPGSLLTISGSPITGAGTLAFGLANFSAHTYFGNNIGSSAAPIQVTATQLTADLNLFTSSLQGLVPLSGGGTTNFLRADGTWAAPPGGGGSIPPNIGGGFRVYSPQIPGFRSLFCAGCTIDSTTNTNGLTFTLSGAGSQTLDQTLKLGNRSAVDLIDSSNVWADSVRGRNAWHQGQLMVGDTTYGAPTRKIISNGASVILGFNATTHALSCIGLLDKWYNLLDSSAAQNGVSLSPFSPSDSSVYNRIHEAPIYDSTKYAFYIISGGDADNGQTQSIYKNAFVAIFDTLTINKGWPANRVIFFGPISRRNPLVNNPPYDTLNRWGKEVCAANGILYADVFHPMAANFPSDFSSDSLHPNNWGHMLIAQAVSKFMLAEHLAGYATISQNLTVKGDDTTYGITYPVNGFKQLVNNSPIAVRAGSFSGLGDFGGVDFREAGYADSVQVGISPNGSSQNYFDIRRNGVPFFRNSPVNNWTAVTGGFLMGTTLSNITYPHQLQLFNGGNSLGSAKIGLGVDGGFHLKVFGASNISYNTLSILNVADTSTMTDVLSWTSGNRVGVNTIIPNRAFHVVGGALVQGGFKVTGDATTDAHQILLYNQGNTLNQAKMGFGVDGAFRINMFGDDLIANSVAIGILHRADTSTFFPVLNIWNTQHVIIGRVVDSAARLQIAAGTTTVAPLQISNGPLLTSPIANMVENDGTHIYWTDRLNTRWQLDQQSGGSGVTTVGAFSGSSQTNGASIATTTITFGPADATNPGMVKASGAQTFGATITLTNQMTFAAATASAASLLITSSAATNPTSPTSGQLWWNGTNLNFRTASGTVDLLAGGGSQTFQQVLTTGATLTGANTVTNTGQTFTWLNAGTGLYKWSGLSHDTTLTAGLLGMANDSSTRLLPWLSIANKLIQYLPGDTTNAANFITVTAISSTNRTFSLGGAASQTSTVLDLNGGHIIFKAPITTGSIVEISNTDTTKRFGFAVSNLNVFYISPVPSIGASGIIMDSASDVAIGAQASIANVSIFGNPTLYAGYTTFYAGVGAHYATVTSNTTLTNTAYYVYVDCTSGNVTITLPAVSAVTGGSAAIGQGVIYHIKRIDASGNTCTVAAAGSDTIDGSATQTLTSNQSREIQAVAGGKWFIN